MIKRAQKINDRWRLKQVVIRGMNVGLKHCKRFIQIYGLGNTIQTIHIEHWFGSLRNSVGCLRRKSPCPVGLVGRLEEKVWVFVSLYNWVIPHRSLSKGKNKRTPAMAAGLTENSLTYLDYIRLPVHKDEQLTCKNKSKIVRDWFKRDVECCKAQFKSST